MFSPGQSSQKKQAVSLATIGFSIFMWKLDGVLSGQSERVCSCTYARRNGSSKQPHIYTGRNTAAFILSIRSASSQYGTFIKSAISRVCYSLYSLLLDICSGTDS